MFYEYLVDIIAVDKNGEYLGGDYPYNRVCWGKDEYDAITKYMPKYIQEMKIDKNQIRLSRIRPTGRYKINKNDKVDPYVECNERVYIMGLITRFMNRFIVSDTLEELEKYKEQFNKYLEEYGHEFPQHVLSEIFAQYEKQKLMIENGEVKPLSYSMSLSLYREFEKSNAVEDLCEHMAKILRMFGFRVEIENKRYIVRIPFFYKTESVIKYYGDRPIYEFSPLELILLWRNNIKTWASERDMEYYRISEEDTNVLVFLGETNDVVEEHAVSSALYDNDITSFVFDMKDNSCIIAVSTHQVDKLQPLLPIICDNLSTSEYDLPFYFDELPEDTWYDEDDMYYESCEICGGRTIGDTVCPNCANNID
jgi:hypothetical protein